MKLLIRIMICFLLVIIFVLLSGSYIFYTRPGLHTALKLLPLLSKNQLHISSGSGVLAKEFELNNITYEKNNSKIYIDHIKIKWQFFKLKYAAVAASISPLLYNNLRIPASQWTGEFYRTKNNIKIQMLRGTVIDKTEIGYFTLSHVNTFYAHWDIRIASLNHFLPGSAGRVSIQGTLDDQKVLLAANLTEFRYKTNRIQRFNLMLKGLLKNKQFTVTVNPKDFIFYSQTFHDWSLRNPATLELRDEHATLHPFTLQSSKGVFTLSGTWKKDTAWQLNESGVLKLPEYAISPTFQLSEKGSTQKISYEGSLESDKGVITLQGYTQHDSTKVFLQGKNFLAINTAEYKAWISPDWVLTNEDKRWNLRGALEIPKARVNIPAEDDTIITLPTDAVFVGGQDDQNAFPLYSTVQLRLGDDIKVAAKGLSGKIEGNVMLYDTPEQLTTGNGRLDIIDGVYQFYGQTLKIKYGNLIFNSSAVTNPGLNIQAVKTITVSNLSGATSVSTLSPTSGLNTLSGEMTVGANIIGTLEEPQITLFSTPATLSQVDILSYLVLGHPASAASPLDAELLLQSTASMKSGSSQVEQIRRELQHLFGIDKLDIESISYVDPTAKTPALNQTTAVVLGKALSPRIYLSYSAGLMGTVNIFTVKYTISKRWLLQSTTSTFGSGVDIFAVW